MKRNLIKHLNWLIPVLVFILTFLPRLYRINNPVADWHSWRQADTAAVARNLVKERFNLLYPQSDSLLALNTLQLPNPDRLFINEFPFYNALVALLYQAFSIREIYARLISVFFAALGAVFLYLLTKRILDQKTALITALFYAFNPYNVYYGRVIMPDPVFVSLSIIGFYFFTLYLEKSNIFIGFLMALALALAMLVKPYAVFILIPMLVYGLNQKGLRLFKIKSLYLLGFFSFIPILLWRYHYQLHPEANFDTTWLFNQTNIRFSGAFFRWLIYDRFNRLIFATGGFVLFFIGLINSASSKSKVVILTWAGSVFLYMTIFAMGNVTHDYYQLPIMPVGSILVAIGFWSIVNQAKKLPQKIYRWLVAVFLLILSFAFGWYEVRGFFNINHPEIVKAGQAVDRLTPKDALVIAPYNADPAFLYQTNRYGWPIGVDIESKIKDGATHYITVSPDNVSDWLTAQCPIVEQSADYLLIDLRPCKEAIINHEESQK